MEKNSGISGGVGILNIILIVFVILKACDLIKWSWWWVLAPLWIELIIIAILLIIILIAYIVKNRRDIKRIEEYLDEHKRK